MTRYFVFFLLAGPLCFNTSTAQTKPAPIRLLRHVVVVSFRPGAPASEISEVDRSFKNLADKLRMVKAYEWGISPIDARNKDIKHVYTSTFTSEKELAAYGASPEHQKHIKLGTAIIKRVEATDYWVEK